MRVDEFDFFSSTTARIALTDARSHSPLMLSAWNESPWSEHRVSKADPGLPTMSWGIFRFFKPSAKSRSCLSPPLQPVSVSICKITGLVSSYLSFLQGILKKSLDRRVLFLRKLLQYIKQYSRKNRMCELLGMSANVPTDICFSLTGLVQRGGKTGPHKDGWGIAFYEGKGLRIFHDPSPGVESKIAAFVRRLPIKSEIVISHIRKANRGKVDLKNTHPFVRELWGFHWTLAHNGQFKKIKEEPLGDFQPVGSTDSEYAFCWLLGKLKKKFGTPPRKEAELFKAIESLMSELHQKGVSNILLSDSRNLYTFCSTKLSWITRKSPFGKARLVDADLSLDFRKVTTPGDRVTVIATQPLTSNEKWAIYEPGEFCVWRKGKIVFSNR